MKLAATHKIWTDEQLAALKPDEWKHELWYGKIVAMPPPSPEHGMIVAQIIALLYNYTTRRKLGRIFDQSGFRLNIDLCFAPDASFVSTERLKLLSVGAPLILHGAPDLAVEVLSPSDSITKTEEKLNLLIAHGTRLAWMVNLKHRWVRVYRDVSKFTLLKEGQSLTENSVLPGFRYPITKLFQQL